MHIIRIGRLLFSEVTAADVDADVVAAKAVAAPPTAVPAAAAALGDAEGGGPGAAAGALVAVASGDVALSLVDVRVARHGSQRPRNGRNWSHSRSSTNENDHI